MSAAKVKAPATDSPPKAFLRDHGASFFGALHQGIGGGFAGDVLEALWTLVWRGLVNYGVHSDAEELAAKTVQLFGPDLDRFGTLHEYYQPENGEPILNPGFQN